MKKLLVFPILFAILLALFLLTNPFRALDNDDKSRIVEINATSSDAVSLELIDAGIINSFTIFNIAYTIKGGGKIEPGAYYLSKNMDMWQIIDELNEGPDLIKIVVLEGMRKEQIGEKLQSALKWDNRKLDKWINEDTTQSYEYIEGVYFPDTYFIPKEEDGKQIARRMINNFDQKFAPFYQEFENKNIKWTTAIKIASIIEREAAGTHDMALISGIIWNRLNEEQKLDIDATIQYSLGKKGKWWPRITGEDIRNNNSRFNTYVYKGLPPHPISNPGLSSIRAVLNPEETDCLYYLHDRKRQIHCSKTYKEHLVNIDKYLN